MIRGARIASALRWLVPLLVTSALLYGLLSEHRDAFARIDAASLLRLAPIMLVYAFASLGVDGLALARLSHHAGRESDVLTCARIKAASYALAIVNYALGAAALVVLFRRRVGHSLQGALGIVATSSLTDLAMLVAVMATIAAATGGDGPTLHRGVAAAVAVATIGGLAVLRAPFPLGPLERIRGLDVFRPIRTAPLRVLLELAALRIAFVLLFVAMGIGSLWSFSIDVPLGPAAFGMAVIALVGALPIAVAGLGTVQFAAVELYDTWADPATLVACSLAMQAAMIVVRGGTALVFAREFTAEAVAASRAGADGDDARGEGEDVARARR
ncbi:MAG: lysylphosphatidylglycerol synthase domain-containing protein [Myxococcota bacterium]